MGDNIYDSRTFRLFAPPSFASGMARLVDFGGGMNVYNRDGSPAEADARAIHADWEMVGRDMQEAFEHERKKQAAR